MKERRWTREELVSMSNNEFVTFNICLRARAWGLLGIDYKEWIRWFEDFDGSLVVQYE